MQNLDSFHGPPPRPLLGAVGEILVGNGKNCAVLDIDVPDHAEAVVLAGEFRVVAAGTDAGDRQTLVVIDRSVLVVLALIRPPDILARRRQMEPYDRRRGQVPEADALAVRARVRATQQSDTEKREQQSAHLWSSAR